jgi:hypothetical protein
MSIASQANVSPGFGSMAGCQLMFNLQLRDESLPEAYNGRRITETTATAVAQTCSRVE